MSYIDSCKGCSASVRIASDDIKAMVLSIINSRNFNIVPEGIYSKRLQQCGNCKYLEYNTTCTQCGCIVQIRALQQDKDCPHPKKSLWK
ncbi:hypothetical protein BCD91_000047 [Clostridium beijerinckii]|uniref:DUF6171 family protein n=1 Tax=Clostridium beijerinckii TaxID=1520 RepID=UPI001494EFED|nr:DUF6171 family protein [Clostridium beijerinckii]NOW88024.1 hypothetical protein [Clostridium beijerinckii]